MRPLKRQRAQQHQPNRQALALGAALLAVAGLATVAGFSSRGLASAVSLAADASPSPSTGGSCAWPHEATAGTMNEFAPDSSAAYWTQPFTVSSGMQITLSGTYPDARYASFAVYTSTGQLFNANGVSSQLTDYLIRPNSGSTNPWQQHGAAPGGSFTVTANSSASAGQANTLPLAPAGTAAGTTGYLMFRVYLPSGGNFAAVSLPTITIQQDGSTVTLQPCTSPSTSSVTPGGGASSAQPSQATQFSRPESNYPFPNADSGYLTAAVPPPGAGNVVVVSGKAPTYAAGDRPSPWPQSYEDVRYWSMCNYLDTALAPLVENTLPGGNTDYGCRADEDTELNSQGYYTYVVGTEAQRAAIEAIPGATFIPFSTADPTSTSLLMFRNMLANSGFQQAIQNVTPGSTAAVTQTDMGAYYPQLAVCALSTLQSGGPQACLSGS